MNTMKLVGLLLMVAAFGIALQGCSVNVIVAPYAVVQSDSGNERNTGVTYQEAGLYDCMAGPDADVCQ